MTLAEIDKIICDAVYDAMNDEAKAFGPTIRAALRAHGMEVVSVEAVNRQFDNMAFILNHATLPEQWHEKFVKELAEDRAMTAPPTAGK